MDEVRLVAAGPGWMRQSGSLPLLRTQNSILYRLAHWPLWIVVFFLLPGPSIVRLLASGFAREHAMWLGIVAAGTGLAGACGRLPGAEPLPYIVHFGEDRPNPLYRRICFTAAWTGILTYAAINLIGLIEVLWSGTWHLQRMYPVLYFPIAATVWILGAVGLLPRARPSTQGEREERRVFDAFLLAACIVQPAIGAVSQLLPQVKSTYILELAIFAGVPLALIPFYRRS
jgi:hypothetical protein